MGDMSILTTSGVNNADEWHDASAEGSPTNLSSNPLLEEINQKQNSFNEKSKKKANTGTNDKRSMQFNGNTGVNVDLNIGPAPLCYEEKAIKERENCDYSIKITLDMARAGTAPRKIRIYADGRDISHIIHDIFYGEFQAFTIYFTRVMLDN